MRIEAGVDALPTRKWLRGMIAREVARTATLAAAACTLLFLLA